MSRVVFVGNVPYDMTEEQLIEVFSAVGPVAGFRLVFDRESGKPKGFGFCEFYDHETAASAVRNLNGTEVKGRPLRIDLADSDPSLEGKTTYRGELEGGDSKALSIPPGAPVPAGMTPLDVISNVLGTVRPAQLMEVMGHMKMFVISHPEDARKLLQTQPQLAYALFQAMLMNNIVDPSVLQRMLNASATSSQGSATSGLKAHHPPPPPPTASQYSSTYSQPHHPSAPAPSVPSAMQVPSFPLQLPAQSAPPYYGGPPAPLTSTPAPPSNLAAPTGLDETKKAMLMQVLSLTPAQIQALPPDQRATIEALKAQLGVP